jgi:hypothetical protein
MLKLKPIGGFMKKLVLFVMIMFTITGCKVVTLESLQKQCSQNKALVLFFSKPVDKPITVKIDNKEIPIVSVFSGEVLELYRVPEGKHILELSSNFYIFSKPIRELEVKYDSNCAQQVLIRNYRDKLIEDKGENSFFSKLARKFMFWKKEKGIDENSITDTTIYGKFTK